jgi:hypothetical protein
MKTILFIYITLLLMPSAITFGQENVTKFDSESWPEADLLFHSDHRWKGADGAYSVDLGNERILWLFADTYIAYKSPFARTRACVNMIRNSIAIQKGYDPSNADIQFFWQNDNTIPKSFFPEIDATWLWPLDGIRLGDKLIVFFSVLHGIESGLGFQVCGCSAKLIENPDENPGQWLIKDIPLPFIHDSILVGSALEIFDEYLYSFCCREPENHDIMVCRWPLDSAGAGHLLNPEWWCGEPSGWMINSKLKHLPETIFRHGATEFSVWYDSSTDKFFQVQTIGFGQAQLFFRQVEQITGPWSEPEVVYEPPENNIPDIMIYAGKAHPYLYGADIILTYATNAPESLIVADSCLYYPRFVRVNFNR